MNPKPTVCVFCGSSTGTDPAYAENAKLFGRLLGESGFNLLFGGGYVGLMGLVAHAARESGAYVTGILPEFLRHLEPPSHDAQRVIITPDLQERKRLMLGHADGFAILSGGLGTMDEFFEVITAAQLEVFDKPIALVDTKGVFASLEALLGDIVSTGFAGDSIKQLYRRVATPEQAIAYLSERLLRAPRA